MSHILCPQRASDAALAGPHLPAKTERTYKQLLLDTATSLQAFLVQLRMHYIIVRAI